MPCHSLSQRRLLTASAWTLLLLTGCSSGRDAAPVSGRVTIDGQPAADVQISFQPQTGPNDKPQQDAVGSYAITDAEGKFTLHLSDTDEPGALVGTHTVRLADKLASVDVDGGPVKGKPPRFPVRYSDGSQTFEVKPGGTDQANFDLQSK